MQTPSDLRWDDLRLVLALFRGGSLKRAAVLMGVNISTASRRLDALEAAIGQHLFDRTPEGTRPTAAAELMLPFAESMEQASVGISHVLDGLEAEPEGLVRITAPPGLSDHFLAPAIGELIARHPRLRIEIISSIGYADLTRREADIALRLVRPASGDLVAVKLGTSTYTIVASPALASSAGTVAHLDDIRWVTYRDDLAHLPEVAWLTAQVDPERIVLRSNSLTTQIEAVRTGLGAKLEAPAFLELPGLAELQLEPSLARSLPPMPEGSLWMVGHRALRNVPRIAAVWTYLVERFGSVLRDDRTSR